MPVPGEVFLSHSSSDRAFTARFAEVVRDHGVPVWYSDTNILGGRQWHDEIGAALYRCDWLVVVLTPDAATSRWVKRGFLFAILEEWFDGRIAPILFRLCNHDELSWHRCRWWTSGRTSTWAAATCCGSGASGMRRGEARRAWFSLPCFS